MVRGDVGQLKMPVFRNKEETRPIISLGRRNDPYILFSDSEDDAEEIEFEKAVLERQCIYEPSRTRKHLIVRKLLFCLLLVGFVSILVSVFYFYFTNQSLQRLERIQREELRVRIDGGYVHGVFEEGLFVFKGIPYATPPLHSRRWQFPERCIVNGCWNGTFTASDFGEKCVQPKLHSKKGKLRNVEGSEDCLFINVWSPTTSDKKLSVLVYIHGGGFVSSSGNEAGLHPTPELVKELNVVAVSFNYRLNAFGFLALDVLSSNSQYNTSGNYGFMDQIMALKWVQNNIKKFGGDSSKVTLLGQGSGGTSVIALMTSPHAKGLFHSAITMSPSADIRTSASKASKDNMVFLTNTKCHGKDGKVTLQCLYGLSPTEIITAIPWSVYPYWSMKDRYDLPTAGLYDGGIAIIDGYVIPKSPVHAFITKSAHDIPLIIGSTAQEIGLNPKKDFSHSSVGDVKKYTQKMLLPFFKNNQSKIDRVFELYDFNSNKSPQLLYLTLASDIREVCPVEYLALTKSKSDVYRYIVTHTPHQHVTIPTISQDYKGLQYSFHMWDLIAFFGYPKAFNYKPATKTDMFAQTLRTEFKHFIHSGKMQNANWTTHNEHIKTTAIFTNEDLDIISSVYHLTECIFWLDNEFLKYSWVN